MKTNYHTHTIRCKHANGSDEDIVLSAIKGGLTEIGFSDHCPWPFENGYTSKIRMDLEQMDDYVNSIRYLQNKYHDKISIKIGLECEFYEEYIPWLKCLKEKYKLDYFIFGNHFPQNETHSYYFGQHTKTKKELADYLESSIKGIESGLFAYFAHPDLFMRSYEVFDEHCAVISRILCQKAKEFNVPLEYNLSGYLITDMDPTKASYPHPEFWKIATEFGCRAIIGYDAHEHDVYETNVYYQRALEELSSFGIEVLASLDL